MKEKIKNLILMFKKQNAKTLLTYAGIFLFAMGVISFSVYYFTKGANPEIKDSLDLTQGINPEDGVVSIVGTNVFLMDKMDKNALNNSWPAEVISNEVSQIQPQREGTIIDWRVHIGQLVDQGQILGKISAPPATPELIKMLSEQTESLAMAQAEASITDEYIKREQARLDSLNDSLSNNSSSKNDQVFMALEKLRSNVETKKNALRTFIERTLANHTALLTNFSSWKYVKHGGLNRMQFGVASQDVQNSYEDSLVALTGEMKETGADLPIKDAQDYFYLAVQLADYTKEDPSGFKSMASQDQKDFFDMLSDYKMAQAEVSDKETEYKLMISEQSAMLQKDKAMALSKIKTTGASYDTVYNEINGQKFIISPRSGIVSGIYKKVGELVSPEMAIATISGSNNANLIARIQIPNNIIKPKVGEILTAIRPGFSKDSREVKIIGIGSSLDQNGSYMADAVFTSNIDWPVESSIRVIASQDSSSPIIKYSSIVWSDQGKASVWQVSIGGRIFAKPIKIGRILGTLVEVYDGLKNGDKYITNPSFDIRENMLLEDIIKASSQNNSSGNGKKGSGSGMEM